MRINLKSGEYYDYYKIKRVEILNNEIIKVTGSFAERTKGKTAINRIDSIKNIRELNRFLKKEMKEFHTDGACPHCGGLNIFKVGTVMYNIRLNEPKQKYKYCSYALGGYHCKSCNKISHELTPLDLVIYYN